MLLAVALTSALVTTAGADDLDELLDRASRLSALGQPSAAANLFGAALAHRSLEQDLLAQQRVADQLLPFLGDDPEPSLLSATLGALPAGHAGALVSAFGLARALAFDAVARGEYLLGQEVGDVLEAQGKLRQSGEAADAFALFGVALSSLSRFEGAASIKPLTKAFDRMIDEGWQAGAVHVGTELAAQLLVAHQADDAREVIESLAAGFTGGGDLELLRRWRDLVASRLSEAPGSVLSAHRALLSYLPDDGEARLEDEPADGAEGARGARGADPDDDTGADGDASAPPSAAVEALASRRAVTLLSVQRDDRVLIVRSPLGAGVELRVDIEPGVVVLTHEGLVFALEGPSVAVLAIELHAGQAEPEPLSALPPGRARYLLADGETFTLDSKAAVTMR